MSEFAGQRSLLLGNWKSKTDPRRPHSTSHDRSDDDRRSSFSFLEKSCLFSQKNIDLELYAPSEDEGSREDSSRASESGLNRYRSLSSSYDRRRLADLTILTALTTGS